ncbi:MAG: ATP-binding protein [Candidatus Caldarchaeum sp.]|nr:ATP-binding protein [Candidatus Caldarchaeum sp.]
MKVLQKKGDSLEILCTPSELNLEMGDYLKIGDDENFLLTQVIDVGYVDLPGEVEDLLKDLVVAEMEGISVLDPYNTNSLSMMVREARTLTAKLRAVVTGGNVNPNSSWLPSRYSAKFEKASADLIKKMVFRDENGLQFDVGTVCGNSFHISVSGLDGSLTIITGKKESGKSHLAKVIVEGICSYGGNVVVFDVNGEYLNLDKTVDGGKSRLAGCLKVLNPGRNFTASLTEMGLKTFLDILEHVYHTPATSLRELARIWRRIELKTGEIELDRLIEAVEREQMNEAVREALLSRLQSIASSGFLAKDSTDLSELLKSRPCGNLLVINLSWLLPNTRRLVVEYLLSRVSTLLSQNKVEPLFLLAEEAHLYLRETYWEDVVTRMRHIGLFPIFITNQPDSIPDLVYRQADNIFLFNFTNENDLEKIARISKVDSETVRLLVKKMPPRHCLVLGKIVSDIPVVLKVKPSNLQTMGKTKLFFKNMNAARHVG